jgi:hypothetical protein
VGRYAQPNPADVEPMLKQIEAQRFHNPLEFSQALEKYGVREDDVRAHLLWQLTLLRFIDVRFRPGIQITDQDIRNISTRSCRSSKNRPAPSRRSTSTICTTKFRTL